MIKENLDHDKNKNYILKDTPDFLVELDIMNSQGKVYDKKQKKYRQINKFLEHIKSIEEYIPKNGYILDIGCGKSYLTFAVYYYFNILQNKNVTIIGIDLKTDVIDACNSLKTNLNYNNMYFYNMDIKDFKANNKINMVISLHACDIATDYAIYNGIKLKADIILSVPCCHHEIFSQLKNKNLVIRHGILKERYSAMLTDSLRSELMEISGYKTDIIEFIDYKDTPKNILIKGVYTGKNKDKNDYFKVVQENNLRPKLEILLETGGFM